MPEINVSIEGPIVVCCALVDLIGIGLKKCLQNFYTRHEKKIKVIRKIFTAGLTLFDVVSDVVLTVTYFINGDYLYGGLTLLFFIKPFILGMCLSIGYVMDTCDTQSCLDIEKGEEENVFWYMNWLSFKIWECIWEAGPQLILQLYIMALPTGPPSMPDNQNATGETGSIMPHVAKLGEIRKLQN